MAKYMNRAEIEAPAYEAVKAAQEAGYSGLMLKNGQSPMWGLPWNDRYPYETGREYRRFAGFVKKLVEAKTPGLDRLLSHSHWCNRWGRDKTSLEIWAVAERQGSPEAAERLYWKTMRRANEILMPYGLKVSYKAIGATLGDMGPKTPRGKAALQAAEQTCRDRFYAVTGVALREPSRGQFFLFDEELRGEISSVFGFDSVPPPPVVEKVPRWQRRTLGLRAVRGWKEAQTHSGPVRAWMGSRVAAGEFASLREAAEAVTTDRLVEVVVNNQTVIYDITQPSRRRLGLEIHNGYQTPGRRGSLIQIIFSPNREESYLVENGHDHLSPWTLPQAVRAMKEQRARNAWKKREVNVPSRQLEALRKIGGAYATDLLERPWFVAVAPDQEIRVGASHTAEMGRTTGGPYSSQSETWAVFGPQPTEVGRTSWRADQNPDNGLGRRTVGWSEDRSLSMVDGSAVVHVRHTWLPGCRYVTARIYLCGEVDLQDLAAALGTELPLKPEIHPFKEE